MIQRSRAQIEIGTLITELGEQCDLSDSWLEIELDGDVLAALPDPPDLLDRL